MIISKNINGSITISDIKENQFIKQIYFNYSLKECKKKFKKYYKNYK